MTIRLLGKNDNEQHHKLMNLYKEAIGEAGISASDYEKVALAMAKGSIRFYGVFDNERLIASCSVSEGFSTFALEAFGVFEDFFVHSEYRGKGVAKKLCDYMFAEERKNGITSVWVGCADCDIDMYLHLGFKLKLGNLLTSI